MMVQGVKRFKMLLQYVLKSKFMQNANVKKVLRKI